MKMDEIIDTLESARDNESVAEKASSEGIKNFSKVLSVAIEGLSRLRLINIATGGDGEC